MLTVTTKMHVPKTVVTKPLENATMSKEAVMITMHVLMTVVMQLKDVSMLQRTVTIMMLAPLTVVMQLDVSTKQSFVMTTMHVPKITALEDLVSSQLFLLKQAATNVS